MVKNIGRIKVAAHHNILWCGPQCRAEIHRAAEVVGGGPGLERGAQVRGPGSAVVENDIKGLVLDHLHNLPDEACGKVQY